MEQLEEIKGLLIDGALRSIQDKVKDALAEGHSAEDILNNALNPGMDAMGDKMAVGEAFIPEVLLSAKTMEAALEVLKPLLGEKGSRQTGIVVIGTVHGDVHNIGKNLVVIMLEAAGFKVIDLGINVPSQNFIDAVEMEKPDIVGMSAMLTTTMLEMGEVIQALDASGLRENVKVMVGGAPINDVFAAKIGADTYCKDCVEAARKAEEFVGKK